ncbi:MAG: 4-hydroxythreonine-4-phosphate dehydrogenase PdxA, partial [Pseudomonadota bacterium]
MSDPQHPIAVTMGDPAGIGPEIIAKVFAEPEFGPPAVVYGDPGIMRRVVNHLAIPVDVREIKAPADARPQPGSVDVIAVSDLGDDFAIGKVDARAGEAAYHYITEAIAAAMKGDVCAIATAPINKESLKLAGVPYPGHTEMLADHSGASDYAMMLFNNELRVILVTI